MKTPIFRLLLSLTVLALLLAACASPTASPETEQPQAPAPETEAPQPEEPAVTGDVPQTGSEPVTIHVLIRPDEGGNVASTPRSSSRRPATSFRSTSLAGLRSTIKPLPPWQAAAVVTISSSSPMPTQLSLLPAIGLSL